MKRILIALLFPLLLFQNTSFANVSLILPHMSGANGTQVTVPVKVSDFDNIISVQGTIQFDPAIITYVSTQNYGLPGMNSSNFGITQVGSGKLTFSWFDGSLAGVTLADSTVIFSITFNIIGSSGQTSALSFINAPTLMEVVNKFLLVETLTLVDGSVQVQSIVPSTDLTLYLDTITSDAGSQVSISLRALDFRNINSIQGTLQWDPSVATYAGISYYGLPGMNAGNFGTSQTGTGKLMFSWSDGTLQGQNLADNAALFSILFNLTGSPGTQTMVDLVDVPTLVEAVDSLSHVLNIAEVSGRIRISSAVPSGSITLYCDTVSAPTASTVDVSMRAIDFINIISAQGTIQFNTAIATYNSITYFGLPNMDISNFGLSQTGSGKIMYSWNDPTLAGVTIADSAILFTMRFNVVGAPGTITLLDLVDTPTQQEYVDNTLTTLVDQLIDGRIRVISSGSVLLSDPSTLTYCPGDPFSFNFTVSGTFLAGNLFILEASGPTGSFASPTALDTVAGTGSGTFTGFIPPAAPAGTGYRFRVVMPTTPSGTTLLCQDAVNSTYSSSSTNASAYVWSLQPPAAGTISGSGATATVDWNAGFTGTAHIQVYGTNGSCTGTISDTLDVQILPYPLAPAKPLGDSLFCQGLASSAYTIPSVAGATSYLWTLNPSGAGSIVGNSTSISVNWNPSYNGTVSLSVSASNGTCSGSSSPALTIDVLAFPVAPAVPSGTTTLCIDPSNTVYTTAVVPNATSYQWTLLPPGAGSITPSANTCTVDWDNAFVGQASLFVYASNVTCQGATSDTLIISINDVPGIAATPVGTAEYCSGDPSGTYTTAGAVNAVSYVWGLYPPAAGSVSGTGTSTSISWTPGWTGTAWLFVYGTNACGNGNYSDSLQIVVHPLPVAPVITQNFNTLLSSYPTGNQWYYNGGLIPGASGQSYIPTINGDYFVIYTDANGCWSSSDTMNVNFVGLDETSFRAVLQLMPNPSNGSFTLTGTELKDAEVIAADGRLISRITCDGCERITFSLKLDAGVYLLRVKTGPFVEVLRLVVVD
jgi:hypothetical protein